MITLMSASKRCEKTAVISLLLCWECFAWYARKVCKQVQDGLEDIFNTVNVDGWAQ